MIRTIVTAGAFALFLFTPPVVACTGDLDGDLDVDQSDLGLLLASYEIDAGGDVDGDGDTDQSDLGLLLADWGCSLNAGPRLTALAADNRGGFWADFDADLDLATVTAAAVGIFIAGADGELGTLDDVSIPGSVRYQAERRQVRFLPDELLQEDYLLRLRGEGPNAIRGLDGRRLDGEYDGDLPSGDGIEGGAFRAIAHVAERTEVVRFDVVVGMIDVLLTPDITPLTVANFYLYADVGDWDGSFIHRSIANFIVQGGGYYYDNGIAHEIPAHDPVPNEFLPGVTTNVRGTITMAKLGGNPDSATNQWFFNVVDNSDALDNHNGGYTAFGSVLGSADLATIDAINALDTVNAGWPFDDLPLLDAWAPIDNDNLVLVERVSSLVVVEPAP
ncbi:MAG: peptidylprolyl isomerase [Phycisphaerales bacterium JB038]